MPEIILLLIAVFAWPILLHYQIIKRIIEDIKDKKEEEKQKYKEV